MRALLDTELIQVQEALMGEKGRKIIDFMFKRSLGVKQDTDNKVISCLNDLGILDGNSLTDVGELIIDPLREYGFWLDRAGKLPSEGSVAAIDQKRFKGRKVVELGSGGGCNLLSLMDTTESVIGVEPMPLYRQMTPVLAKLSGVEPPEVIPGAAENIPIEDETADIVLCYSSHQYMNINVALKEMYRILRSGGELIIVGNTLYPFILETITDLAKNFDLGKTKYNSISIVNTVYYQLSGRHLIHRPGRTTANPIYPSYQYMKKRFADVGLHLNRNLTQGIDSGETVFVANK